MVLGTIYGFVLEWGPILWGLIAFYLIINKRRGRAKVKGKSTEVVLIINCEEKQPLIVEDIIWGLFPLGLAKLNR
jgi:hypothetical protein